MTDWTTPEDVPEVVRERLHDWLNAGNPADAATAGERAVADIIHTFWPVPARTLASELADIAEHWETWTTDTIIEELTAATTRAAQMGHDLAEARAELERVRDAVDPKGAGLPPGMTISETVQTLVDGIPTGERVGLTDTQLKREYDLIEARSELAEVTHARDSLREDYDHARAEVERLRRDLDEAYKTRDARDDEVDRLRAEVERLTAERDRIANGRHVTYAEVDGRPVQKDAEAPDPADVPPREVWVVRAREREAVAVRDGDPFLPWSAALLEGGIDDVEDENVTLITRLVPPPRVITNTGDLDRLAESAVILSLSTQYALQRVNAGDGWYCPATKGKATSHEVLSCGPVTVLWEPEV